MTKEQKQLLLKDLCSRLPYGVICTDNRHGDSRVFNVDAEGERVYYTDFDEWGLIKNCKSYLRPMSSMTSKEWFEFCDCSLKDEMSWVMTKNRKFVPVQNREDYLNAHHLDYRGLIPMGLALEAPEGMYK